MSAEDQHRLRASLRNFKQLLAMQPRNEALLGKLANVCERLGRSQEAADYLVDRAQILVELGDDAAALAECDRAVELQPQHRRARSLLARLETLRLLPGLGASNDTLEADAFGVVDASQLLAVRDADDIGLEPAPPTLPPGVVAPDPNNAIDASLLLAVHDADEVDLTMVPPSLPPKAVLEVAFATQDPNDSANATHDVMDRAVTGKLPQLDTIPTWGTPAPVAGVEAAPVSVDVNLFAILPRHIFAKLLTDAERITVKRGACIVAEGEDAYAMVLMIQGRARVERESQRGPKVLGHIGEDDVVGLVESLHGQRWRTTVVAESPVELRVIDQAAVGDLRSRFPAFDRAVRAEAERQELLILLATNRLFNTLSAGRREALARRWHVQTVLAQETVVQEGNRLQGLYLVASGRLGMYHGSTRIGVLGAGDCVGVLAAVGEGRAHVTITGEDRCEVFFLEWDAAADLLEAPLVREAFEQVASLRRLQA
jgi:CRP-like cAMP-binding protein